MDQTPPLPAPEPADPPAASSTAEAEVALHVAPVETIQPAAAPPVDTTEPVLEPAPMSAPPSRQPQALSAVQHPSHSTSLAVTASVVIILGLAALAVFAYLQTTK